MVRKALFGIGAAFIALTLVGGYGFGWRWTGFGGNGTLWDWMDLCLLPVTLGLSPLAFELPGRTLARVGVVSAAVLTVLIVGGYVFNWVWTGFRGNTLWDWLHLLLVPVALPFVAHELGERQKLRKKLAQRHGQEAETGIEPAGQAAPA